VIERDLAAKRHEMNAAGGPYKPNPDSYARRTVQNAILEHVSKPEPSRIETARPSVERYR
jgi:hypothetical protein